MQRGRRRSVMLSPEKARRVIQDYAVDQFGELAGRKRIAAAEARKRGHDMKQWRRRSNDPAGRWNSFCATCNRLAVVCTETPTGFTDTYGPALTDECGSLHFADRLGDVDAGSYIIGDAVGEIRPPLTPPKPR